MKVLSECVYEGKYEDKSYKKVMLVVSENGRYPNLINVDVDVYQKLNQRLAGKEVEVLYKQSYGKYKISEIKIVK